MRSVTIKKAVTVRDWDSRGVASARSLMPGDKTTVSDRAYQALVAWDAVETEEPVQAPPVEPTAPPSPPVVEPEVPAPATVKQAPKPKKRWGKR